MERKISTQDAQPDLVLANLEWVRALSVKLVGDAASADDLVQEAWIAARASQPSFAEGGRPRPWLAGLLRNLARGRYRQGQGRKAREQDAAKPETTDTAYSPAALVARSEQLASVAQHVLELAEPYRRTMLLRWFDGMTPDEIALEENIQHSTVRTRLHRGRVELKKRLDIANGGDSRPWALALIPFARSKFSTPAAKSAGAIKVGVAAVVILAAGGAALLSTNGAAATETGLRDIESSLVSAPEASEAESATPALASVLGEESTRELTTLSEATAPEAATSPSLPAKDTVLAGRIALQGGEPVPDAYLTAMPVNLHPDAPRTGVSTRSDMDGQFEFEGLPAGRYRIGASTEWGLPLLGSNEFDTGHSDHLMEVDGYVVRLRALDSDGKPVPMTKVSVQSLSTGSKYPTSNGRSKGLNPAQVEHHFTFGARGKFNFYATDAEGRIYSGLINQGHPKGRVDLDLVHSPPVSGTVSLSLFHPDLPDGAKLKASVISLPSRDPLLSDTVPIGIASGGNVQIELTGLLPGDYEISPTLRGAHAVKLIGGRRRVRVDAGSAQDLTIDAFAGGMFELVVRSDEIKRTPAQIAAIQASGETPEVPLLQALVEVREVGTDYWDYASLTSELPDQIGYVGGIRITVGGLPAVSEPFAESRYELKVSAKGFLPVITPMRLIRGATERIEVDLIRAK